MQRDSSQGMPLHVYIIAVASFAVILSGGFLSYYVFEKNKEEATSRINHDVKHLAGDVQRNLESMYVVAEKTVESFSRSSIGERTTLSERLESIDALRLLADVNPFLDSIFVGYENGDYMVFRRVDDFNRGKIRATKDTAYAVQSIERADSDNPKRQFLFFDKELRLIQAVNRPDYKFDPRERAWYKAAKEQPGLAKFGPFASSTTQEWAIAFSKRSVKGRAVVATLITFSSLSNVLKNARPTDSSEIAILNPSGALYAYHRWNDLVSGNLSISNGLRTAHLSDLDPTIWSNLIRTPPSSSSYSQRYDEDDAKRQWLVATMPLHLEGGALAWLALLSPADELLKPAINLRTSILTVSLSCLVLAIVLSYYLAKRIARRLVALTARTEAIRRFEFADTPPPQSPVREIQSLIETIQTLQKTLQSFLRISQRLGSEQDLPKLLLGTLEETTRTMNAAGGAVFLAADSCNELQMSLLYSAESGAIACREKSIPLSEVMCLFSQSRSSVIIRLNEDYRWNGLDLNKLKVDPLAKCVSMVLSPLFNHDEKFVGLHLLVLEGDESPHPARIAFIEALCGTVAIAIDHHRLLEGQRALVDGIIKLIGEAIDAKNPHTSGHCKRVPAITKALAEAANDESEGPFKNYQLTDLEREQIHVASWLHDCGKVTTPEYVIDKSTKLQTLYNRIHEIRMRFEVLKRDAEILSLQKQLAGGDPELLKNELSRQCVELDQEFEFVASCNMGGEVVRPEDLERLRSIARRTWIRTMDDSLGLSWEERARKKSISPVAGSKEYLLDDKPEHLIERHAESVDPTLYTNLGIKMPAPKYRLNLGEIYNLSIGRGTLTAEERYLVNDHIVQTIIMLDSLPLPSNLKRVPEIATGHHEKMDGSGYPKMLNKNELSIEARMMAIADIFEALTAADRPYKTGKKLSETLTIMKKMADTGHIDPDIFQLLLRSGICFKYAQEFMHPSQLDVDQGGIQAFIQQEEFA